MSEVNNLYLTTEALEHILSVAVHESATKLELEKQAQTMLKKVFDCAVRKVDENNNVSFNGTHAAKDEDTIVYNTTILDYIINRLEQKLKSVKIENVDNIYYAREAVNITQRLLLGYETINYLRRQKVNLLQTI